MMLWELPTLGSGYWLDSNFQGMFRESLEEFIAFLIDVNMLFLRFGYLIGFVFNTLKVLII
jgi:hypothetical protein